MESKRNGGGTDSGTCPSGMLERESERVYKMNVRLNADNMLKVLISLHTDCHDTPHASFHQVLNNLDIPSITLELPIMPTLNPISR